MRASFGAGVDVLPGVVISLAAAQPADQTGKARRK